MASRNALLRGLGVVRSTRWTAGRMAAVRFAATEAGSTTRHLPLGQVPESVDRSEVREKWHSDAMDLLEETAPIEVQGNMATCDGGGGPLGHPIEYIRLDNPYPSVCKYCGLKFIGKKGSH
eukprot:Plantae.Rhodophyta-Purpureofilum_apyrenoidigerum.ctg16703.p1 GENE.Plantae.Rhodophyta-Purpureofilum_apyrenoidigerum.ctg16703~~Plantae.Rhodophyta-Purpureofilum_apyrenoidigerum.ctg16703.p1  ORF type:complete len:121 (+),score=11.94 Plantae.Rhodophyta-Purpureofilum_apyrenoidigerum.ctg16703:105-467(+)